MGRYRGRQRGKKWWHNKKNENRQSHQGMPEGDSVLVERYLIEYRSKSYALWSTAESEPGQLQLEEEEHPYKIGNHIFPALTSERCKQPYIDLPDTLSPKERKHIHAMCCMLDLYHCGAGTNEEICNLTTKKRRIVVSIFANGLDHVPDLESSRDKSTFPSRKCRPWYNCASSAMKHDLHSLSLKDINEFQSSSSATNNPFIERIAKIEEEKKQISLFTRYPEQSLRTSLRRDIASNGADVNLQQIDALDLGELQSIDLSVVSTPKQCPWMLVDTAEKLEECVKELMFGPNYATVNPTQLPLLYELAFDLEMYNHSGGEKKTALRTCLIQLTSNVAAKDYVIDTLAPGVWDAVSVHLGPLFSNPSIVKIGHGIGGMDTTSLHRDFGVVVVNAFDTYEASAVIASRRKGGLGLASLCKHYGLPSWEEYSELKHTYQASNWSKRPLDERAIEYGRFDVRCLILLRKLLMRDLVKMDMIGGRNPFDYIKRKGSSQSTSGILSTQTSNAETNSTSESVTESSLYEGSSSIDPYSQTSSFDEFQDAMETIDSPKAEDESTDEFVDASETCSPVKQSAQVLHACDLPPFHHLMQAIKISNKRCLSLWTGDDEEHITKHPVLLSMIEQSSTGNGLGRFWSDAHYKLYIALTKWRYDVAEREGIEVYEVCSLDLLLHVAYKLPLDKFEMRRFAHFLPELLEADNLPYSQELHELIASSEAFEISNKHPSSEMDRFGVVFYQDSNKKNRFTTLKILAAAAVVVSIASIVMIRRRKRK